MVAARHKGILYADAVTAATLALGTIALVVDEHIMHRLLGGTKNAAARSRPSPVACARVMPI